MDTRMAGPSGTQLDIRGRTGYFERQLQSAASRLRWTAFLCLALLFGIGYTFRETIPIFVQGPKQYSAEEFAVLSKEEKLKQPWVHVTGLKLERNYSLISKSRRSGTQTTTYLASHWDEGTTVPPVFVLLTGEVMPASATGWVSNVPVNFSERLRSTRADIDQLNFMNEVGIVDTRSIEIYVLPVLGAVGSLAILLFGLFQWWKGGKLLHSSTSAPLKALLRFGPFAEVLPVINTDLGSGSAKNIGPVRLGTDYLLIRDKSDIQVVQISRLVWAYIEVTQHRYNGIPTGKTYRVMLGDQFGVLVGAKMSKARSEELLDILKNRHPRLFVAFSDELAAAWKQDPIGTAKAIRERDQTKQ